jgi:hypothetical protein
MKIDKFNLILIMSSIKLIENRNVYIRINDTIKRTPTKNNYTFGKKCDKILYYKQLSSQQFIKF